MKGYSYMSNKSISQLDQEIGRSELMSKLLKASVKSNSLEVMQFVNKFHDEIKNTKFYAQIEFYLNGELQSGKNETIESDSKENAEIMILEKYSVYGAEYGEVKVKIFTEDEHSDILTDHLGDDGEDLNEIEPIEDEYPEEEK